MEAQVTNTRARHIEILDAAARVVEEAGGVEQIDSLDQEKRRPALLGMAKAVEEETHCHRTTAKNNVARALRRARYKIVKERAVEKAEAEWGGQRPGAGPPEGNQNQNWAKRRAQSKSHCKENSMHLLPSEQEKRTNEAINTFNETGELAIYEPCDCGSQVRHNNGGNYHGEIYLLRDSGKWFVKYETTCELMPPAEWEECGSPVDIIRQHADWL
jgi:hypothetical protein